MTGEVAGIPVECPKCRNGLPADARYCRRCGGAQGGDPVTRAARSAGRVHRRLLARAGGPLFGIEPVLWLFAVLGGLGMAGVRHFDNLVSAEALGYAIGGTLVLLLLAGLSARVAWALSGRSQTAGIFVGMAVIFFVTFGVIANAVNPPAPREKTPFASAAASPVPFRLAPPPPAPAPALQPSRPPIHPLPATAVAQLAVQWRYSGRKLECVVTNHSTWQVEDLQMEVVVWANRRTVETFRTSIVAIIPSGEVGTLEVPLDLALQPRQAFDCRVLSARGFEAALIHRAE
jgi:hypothetical protein